MWTLFKVNNEELKSGVINVNLVSSLSILNRFDILFLSFHCWIWTTKCRRENVMLTHLIPLFHSYRKQIYSANQLIGSFMQKQPSEVFCKKSGLKKFANFRGKHPCWSLLLIKLRAFPVKFAKVLRTRIL